MLFVVVAVVAVMLLVAGCSKQTPVTEPAAASTGNTPQVAAPVPTPTQTSVPAAVVQEEPAVPPELTQADETAQELDTSDLDQIDKDVDALTVP